ncbi:hypothetical protein KY326_03445, partial [Candidatus Woesearchaeota archaeon]|nr:hypothetical protein [Candidatus Woesearchaeota archaeon]
TAEMEFLFTDAENSNVGNDFNNPRTTLLVKGGHDILGYLERRFRKKKLEYGVILAADVANPRPELIEGMCHRGYTLTGAVEGTGVIAPFSMELRNVYIFQKGRPPIIG